MMGWTPPDLFSASSCQLASCGVGCQRNPEGVLTMDATTVAVDLAKSVFQLAIADDNWRIVHKARLSRAQFQHWFDNRQVGLVLMEACGSAHHWARTLQARGIEVRLLPPRYV